MKRVADTRKPPVVVPVVVVAVHVHVAVIVPEVERGKLCRISSSPLLLECSQSCILLGIGMP